MRSTGRLVQDDGRRLPDALWCRMEPLLPERPVRVVENIQHVWEVDVEDAKAVYWSYSGGTPQPTPTLTPDCCRIAVAIASATGSLTAPCASSSASDTPRRAILAALL